ncbi:MAG: DNA mismatch repair protein MutS, partial [Bacteroidales bacterium]
TSENEKYRWEAMQIEDQIRQKLSKQLLPFGRQIQQNLDQLAYLDVLIAKSIQKKEWALCKPEIGTDKTVYQQLFNPAVQSALNDLGRVHKFQPIDMELFSAPTLITGANMSGKTVLLKTVALAQYLFQFGFYVPANKAVIMPVEEILFSIGDQQSEMDGLSSFAVEILNVNKIMIQAKKRKKILALVDELARTTNPEEGKALVSAFIEMMTRYQVNALITSHYNGIEASCRRLRVKGLAINRTDIKITPENIADYMDYSLLETDSDEVPMEGMTIARIFDIDSEFLTLAQQMIQR